jgi:acyl-coenzyme A thioesterase PaaI-like protein
VKLPITAWPFEKLRIMTASANALLESAENISTGGFNLHAGPFYRLPDDGEVRRFAFRVLDKHMNGSGSVHGGLLMTFADIAMSRTSRLASGAKSCSTVSLSCDFAGAGKLGDVIEIHVRVTRRTRTLMFMSSEMKAGDRVLMAAQGLWKILP